MDGNDAGAEEVDDKGEDEAGGTDEEAGTHQGGDDIDIADSEGDTDEDEDGIAAEDGDDISEAEVDSDDYTADAVRRVIGQPEGASDEDVTEVAAAAGGAAAPQSARRQAQRRGQLGSRMASEVTRATRMS